MILCRSKGEAAAGALTWRQLVARLEAHVGTGHEARRLVEQVSGWDAATLTMHGDDAVPSARAAQAAAMANRRLRGEPLQYVLGRWSFRHLDLVVDRRVLIPRPETELVAGLALAEVTRVGRHPPRLVDLGTGSGAIALSVAVEHRQCDVWATDVSVDALAVAQDNLAALGAAAARVCLAPGSWWEAVPSDLAGRIDVVVSNPPYVADHEELPPVVGDWEPIAALRAGPTGLEALETIVVGAPGWLARPGSLVLEIAPHQADVVSRLATNAGFSSVEVVPDLVGRLRAVVARLGERA